MAERVVTITDPFNDIDDIIALYILAKSSNVINEGVVTTYGNPRIRAKGVSKFFRAAGLGSIPVYYGTGGKDAFDVPNYMQETDYEFLTGDELEADDDRFGIKPDGECYIARLLETGDKNLSIASLAPMTTLAKALEHAGTKTIKKIHAMAGHAGDYTLKTGTRYDEARVPEYNIACDVEAARKVFDSGVEIYTIGKNLWMEGLFTPKDFETLKNGTEPQKQISRMIRLRDALNKKTLEPLGITPETYMFDPITVGSVLFPELYDFQKIDVFISDTGIMETTPSKSGNIYGAASADLQKIKNNLMEIILG